MKTRLNVSVRGLFATPVAAMEVPDAEARNSELILTTVLMMLRILAEQHDAFVFGPYHRSAVASVLHNIHSI